MTTPDGDDNRLNILDFMAGKDRRRNNNTAPAAAKPAAPPGHITPYAAAAIDSECGELAAMPPNSGRNHRLNTAAFNLASLVYAGEVTEQYVRDRLLDAARASGLEEHEIPGTIDSGFRGAAAKVGARQVKPLEDAISPAAVFTPAPAPAVEGGSGEDSDQPDPFSEKLTDGASFILDIPETVPALWGDQQNILWMEGESLMIAGPMGLGKTTLGGQLMRAQLGIGPATVLDLPCPRIDGKILYLAMDRPAQARRALARQFKESDRAVLAERLIVWQGPPPGDVAKYPQILALLAERAGAAVVYLDSVKDAAVGLSDDAVGAGYNRARQQLLADGRQLCELHHTTKRNANGGPPKDVADIYGSTWITNGTGSIILLSGQPGDPIVGFHHARQPMNEVGPFKLNHDQANGVLTVTHEVDPVDLLNHAGADGLTARALAIALWHSDEEEPRPSTGEVEKARRRLEQLVELGLAVCVEGTRGRGNSSAWFPATGTSFDPKEGW